MSPRGVLAFVRRHGLVLASARGELPCLAEAVAGGPIRGSWWAHPRSHAIFAALQAACASHDVLVCRLAGGRLTLVHRRLWPALVRLVRARRLPASALARVAEEHTPSGRHVVCATPLSRWLPADVEASARALSVEVARETLGPGVAPALGLVESVELRRGAKRSLVRPGARPTSRA